MLRIAADRDGDRHEDRGQRPEDEEEDHDGAEGADHRLEQDVPAPEPCVLASSSGSWPVTLTVIPLGRPFCAAARMSCGAARRRERREARRVDLLERRVLVRRDVHGVRVSRRTS